MAEEYDTNAFMVFVVAILSMYVLFASIFLIKRIRRVIKKEPIVEEWIVWTEGLEEREEETVGGSGGGSGGESSDDCVLDQRGVGCAVVGGDHSSDASDFHGRAGSV